MQLAIATNNLTLSKVGYRHVIKQNGEIYAN